MAKMKLKNEVMSRYLETLIQIDGKSQTGLLAYAISTNKRKLAEAVQDYEQMKNDVITKLREELDISDNDSAEEKARKQKEFSERLNNELKDVAWVEQEVDLFLVDIDTFCSGTLNSSQMDGLLWMVK